MSNAEKSIEVHVHAGGQFNLALDEAHIEAVQNNSSMENEAVDCTFLDIEDEKEYVHKIFENGKESCRIAEEKDVANIPDERIEEFKRQLGHRLKGDETKLQVISKLLHEMEETLHTGRRYGVLPMFSYIPRGNVRGYIYLDDSVMPYADVDIEVYYWDAYEKYIINTKYYFFLVLLHDGKVVYYETGYNLSFPDVKERLYGFGKVKAFENAKRMTIYLPEEKRKILVDSTLFQKEGIDDKVALTDYWIEQMKMIDVIEEHYKIKFYLPKKATEQDYQAIHVLYCAINKFSTSTFPAVPEEKMPIKRTFRFNEDIIMNNGDGFPCINLFGYCFKPVAAYVMQCTMVWKKKIRAWEVEEGGIPVRVEFVCYKN